MGRTDLAHMSECRRVEKGWGRTVPRKIMPGGWKTCVKEWCTSGHQETGHVLVSPIYTGEGINWTFQDNIGLRWNFIKLVPAPKPNAGEHLFLAFYPASLRQCFIPHKT